MKIFLPLFFQIISVGLVFGQTKQIDIHGVWVFKKSVTLMSSGNHVIREEGQHMMDTLFFLDDGKFEFIYKPRDASIYKRFETGNWKISKGNLVLYARQNEVGMSLPDENLKLKAKGSRKLRIYYTVGGIAANHYEQYTALKKKK